MARAPPRRRSVAPVDRPDFLFVYAQRIELADDLDNRRRRPRNDREALGEGKGEAGILLDLLAVVSG